MELLVRDIQSPREATNLKLNLGEESADEEEKWHDTQHMLTADVTDGTWSRWI